MTAKKIPDNVKALRVELEHARAAAERLGAALGMAYALLARIAHDDEAPPRELVQATLNELVAQCPELVSIVNIPSGRA